MEIKYGIVEDAAELALSSNESAGTILNELMWAAQSGQVLVYRLEGDLLSLRVVPSEMMDSPVIRDFVLTEWFWQ